MGGLPPAPPAGGGGGGGRPGASMQPPSQPTHSSRRCADRLLCRCMTLVLSCLHTPRTPLLQWYYRLFEETQRGLTRVTSLETVHGSLLALGELLRHTGG